MPHVTFLPDDGRSKREDEMADLDPRDSEVLEALQRELPITPTPYAILGQMVDMSEKEVIKRTIRLRQNGAIRAMRVRFDPKALGCSVALVIASVPEDRVDAAAEIIDSHPGVSQNYKRNHEFNLWFTLCLPSSSLLGLDETVRIIGSEAGVTRIHALPAIRQFRDGAVENDPETVIPDERAQRRIHLLQEELPIQPRPFDVVARKLEEQPDELIEFIRGQKELGTITHVGPVLTPAKSRFSASAMGVWNVPPDRLDQVGLMLSEDEMISACTIREPQEEWPYNLFTIIHGRSVDECEKTMERLAGTASLQDYQALFSVHEYKRTPMNLFPAELEAWERTRSSGPSTRTAAS